VIWEIFSLILMGNLCLADESMAEIFERHCDGDETKSYRYRD
jgi:hypothetical protein